VTPILSKLAGACVAMAFLALVPAGSARADDAGAALEKTHGEIEQMFGKMPDFLKALPEAGLPGAWNEAKAIEFSDGTALPAKMKSLIALAVAAQIPCAYCIWADTQDARRTGATDEEIKEAVAMAAIERHWSTILNGMQVDMGTFKKDLDAAAARAPQ
jgi:AhpD family alkylhydroperoxidase